MTLREVVALSLVSAYLLLQLPHFLFLTHAKEFRNLSQEKVSGYSENLSRFFPEIGTLVVANDKECMQFIDPVHRVFGTKILIQQVHFQEESTFLDHVRDEVLRGYQDSLPNFHSDEHKNAKIQQSKINNFFFLYQTYGEGKQWMKSLPDKIVFMEFFKSIIDIFEINRLSLGCPESHTDGGTQSETQDGRQDQVRCFVVGECGNGWFSVHNNETAHAIHIHDKYAVSGTIYIQSDDDSGRIFFVDSRMPLLYNPKESNTGRYSATSPTDEELFQRHQRSLWIKPKPGLLILFPSWLKHGVLPTRFSSVSSASRIAFSFNFRNYWFQTFDNSMLDLNRCTTKAMVDANTIGVYGRNREKELYEINLSSSFFSGALSHAHSNLLQSINPEDKYKHNK